MPGEPPRASVIVASAKAVVFSETMRWRRHFIRQRVLPLTAGDLQLPPLRVFAPHRGLASMGTVFVLGAGYLVWSPCPANEATS